jgi:hypothetical protein
MVIELDSRFRDAFAEQSDVSSDVACGNAGIQMHLAQDPACAGSDGPSVTVDYSLHILWPRRHGNAKRDEARIRGQSPIPLIGQRNQLRQRGGGALI